MRVSGRAAPRTTLAMLVIAALTASPRLTLAQITGPERAAITALVAKFDRMTGPGFTLLAVRHDSMVYRHDTGLANLDDAVPIGPRTVFGVGSIAKQFTAFGIALLAQQGRLALTDDVRRYIPELQPMGQPVRIGELVHHTSGYPDLLGILALAGIEPDDRIGRAQAIGRIARLESLVTPPGTQQAYSNAGYLLLSEVIARVTRDSFVHWMKANVFEPIGMTATHFEDDAGNRLGEVVPHRAVPYRGRADAFEPATRFVDYAGPSGLRTTAADLAKWLMNLETGRVGGAAVRDRMRERGVLAGGDTINYAFGLIAGAYRGRPTVMHAGSVPGVQASVVLFTRDSLGIVVLANCDDMNLARLPYDVADVLLAGRLAPVAAAAATNGSFFLTDDPQPAPPESHGVVPDPAVLRGAPGRYRTADREFEVRNRDESLELSFGEAPFFQLFAIPGGRFLLPRLNYEFSFPLRTDGARDMVLHLTARSVRRGDPRDIPAPRVTLSALSASQLADLTGRYQSDEAETEYEVAVNGGEVFLAHPRFGTLRLRRVGEDQYVRADDAGAFPLIARVRFEHGTDGRVSGITLEAYAFGVTMTFTKVRVPAPASPVFDAAG